MLLHKSKVGTHLSYNNGGFTNNLRCDNISIEVGSSKIVFSVDFECNLRVRNKQSNCYYDVNEFMENHAELKMFQISDKKSYEAVKEAYGKNVNTKWFLEILVGDKGPFEYEVSVRGENDNLEFNIQN